MNESGASARRALGVIGQARLIASGWVMIALVASCGADGIDAPASPPRPECRRIDDYLGPLYDLADRGKLSRLRGVIADELPEDTRRDLIDASLRLAAGFEPGSLSALAGAVTRSGGGIRELSAVLARLLRWIAASGPGAPYPHVVASLRGVLNTCEGPPSLTLLAGVLRDEALLRALVEVGVDGGLSEALAALSLDGVEGREALTLLLRNLMVAASGPDFSVTTVVDALGLVVDLDAGPWPALVAGLERQLGAGPGSGIDALEGLLACALEVDPEVSLGPLVWDALVASPISGDELVALLPAPGEPALPAPLAGVLARGLELLAGDPEARRALVAGLTVFLRADLAPGVMLDLADLLESEVLSELVELLGALAQGECP